MTSYILIHGGGMGGWVWRYVAGPLRAQGHAVYTPTLTGFGERAHLASRSITTDTHIQDVLNMMDREEIEDAVLVVHSYAGSVAPGLLAAAGNRISRVVYVDAVVPMTGESVAEALGFMNASQVEGLRALHARGEGPLGAGVPETVRKMADAEPQLMSPERDAWVFKHLTDMPLSANISAVPVGAESIKHAVTYLAAPYTMMKPMHERAAGLGWTVHQLGGQRDHMVHVGDPESVLAHL